MSSTSMIVKELRAVSNIKHSIYRNHYFSIIRTSDLDMVRITWERTRYPDIMLMTSNLTWVILKPLSHLPDAFHERSLIIALPGGKQC